MPLMKAMFPNRQTKDWLPTVKIGEVHTKVEKIIRPAVGDGQISGPMVQKVRVIG